MKRRGTPLIRESVKRKNMSLGYTNEEERMTRFVDKSQEVERLYEQLIERERIVVKANAVFNLGLQQLQKKMSGLYGVVRYGKEE